MAASGSQSTATSFFDDVLKIDYMGPVREQLNQSTVLLKKLETRMEDFSGKQAYLPLHTGRNFAIGSRGETDNLPGSTSDGDAIYRQQYDNATFNASYQYGRISVTGPVIKASRNNKGAFLKAVDAEMKGMLKDLKNSVNRQLFSDGTGTLTETALNSNTVTIAVDSTKFLKVGMRVEVRNATTHATTEIAATAITAVTAGTSFTIGAAGTTTAAALVVLEGTIDNDLWGLDAIVSEGNPASGNFGAIDRTTAGNEFWKATDVSTVVAGTLKLMQESVDTADITGEGDVSLIVTSHAAKRQYGDKLVANKRYPPGGEITLDGGFKALEFNGIPMVGDKDAHNPDDPDTLNAMYFLDTTTLFFIQMNPWEWMDKDGATLARITDRDAYEATLFRYFNLVSDQPNANVRMLLDETAAFG